MRGAKAYRGLQDGQLVALVAERDPGALEALYDRYGAVAWSLARRLLGDEALAQGVVRDVFAALWRDGARSHPDQSVDTRLLVMTYRRAVEAARRGARRTVPASRGPAPRLAPGGAADPPARRRGSAGPPRAAAGERGGTPLAQRRARARAMLAALAPAQREALTLACFDGYTQREIASLMGVPPAAAAERMADGMRRLREALAGDPDPERLP